MHEETLKRLHAGLDLEPSYTGLYNSKRSPVPEEYTLDMKVEVESWRLEVLLSQLLPPSQYDVSPPRSSAAGTGLEEAGVPHPEMQQTKQEETVFLHVHCTKIPEQEGT